MSDLIDRQAAIDLLKQMRKDGNMVPWEGKDVFTRIRKLPSAQPERKPGRWIPVSERLPDEHEWIGTKRFGTTISDEVYVTFENPKGERFTRHLSFQNGKLSISDQQTIDAFFKGSVPIAWMSLPDPYTEAGDE